MGRKSRTVLLDQGRGIVGALIVSVEMLFTMEMWWHGWQLPAKWLLIYTIVGLTVVLLVARTVGFHEERQDSRIHLRTLATDFTELLLQSFVTAYFVLLMFGIVDLGTPFPVTARLGLIFVVPLGFGAALANELFAGAPAQNQEEGGDKADEQLPFYRHLSTFAVGAIFLSMTMSPTDEMELMTVYSTWDRLAVLVILSVLTAYLILFELEFAGQERRIGGRDKAGQLGYACIVYMVGVVVAMGLLASYGHFGSTPFPVWVQEIVVLGFPTSIGAAGAQVVVG